MADITIGIGSETRALADASESWIAEQINRRRKDGQNVCVAVAVCGSGVDLRLATPGCRQSGGGGGRPPSSNEQDIFNLWTETRTRIGGIHRRESHRLSQAATKALWVESVHGVIESVRQREGNVVR